MTDHRRTVIAAIALTLASSVLGLTQPLLAKQAIDSAGRGQQLWALMLGLALLFVGQASISAVGRFLLERRHRARAAAAAYRSDTAAADGRLRQPSAR